ncbi:coronin-2B-like isoform X2 [Amphiura filiformis]|uniref:coronin-2B-like isoform X2 n=1 Tax=Amphiura filiformis TaxID=82378 RepID=UPI003B2109FB
MEDYKQEMPMFKGVRYSKYRHVYGKPFRKEKCYDGVPISKNAHESNFCCINLKYVAIITESAGGGSFVVIPIERSGRLEPTQAKVTGHSGPVLDIKWNPFNDDMIASCSDDTTVKIWEIPEGGICGVNLTDHIADLRGHSRRVGQIEWHPTAENILASAAHDCMVIVWNIASGEEVCVIDCHPQPVFSLSFNWQGNLLATTCKDKKMRVINPRTGELLQVGQCHTGSKSSKLVFAGDSNFIISVGLTRSGERQIALWNKDSLQAPLCMRAIDSGTGALFLYYDSDSRVAFVAGKGDGNMRYFEILDEKPYIYYLNEFQTSSPQRGFGVMPKRGIDITQNEMMRFYKLHTTKGYCEPLSMIVPRKSDKFQEDLYPATPSNEPAMTAEEWIGGMDKPPVMTVIGSNRGPVSKHTRAPLKSVVVQPKKQDSVDSATSSPKSEPKYTPTSSPKPSKPIATVVANVQQESEEPIIKKRSSSPIMAAPSPKRHIEPRHEKDIDTAMPEPSKPETNSIASRMAIFENKGSKGTGRGSGPNSPIATRFSRSSTSSSPSESPRIERQLSMSAVPDKKERMSSTSSTGSDKEIERTINRHGKEVFRIALQPVRQQSLPPDVEDVRTNGDGKETHDIIPLVKETKMVRREFLTSKDMGKDMQGMDQLRKAFLRQQEEIKQLKTQLMLKDQRIRQLEREIESINNSSSC